MANDVVYVIHGQNDYSPVCSVYRQQTDCIEEFLKALPDLEGFVSLDAINELPSWVDQSKLPKDTVSEEYYEALEDVFRKATWDQQVEWANNIPADGGTFLWLESTEVR